MNVDVYQVAGSDIYVFVPQGKKPAEVEGTPPGPSTFFKTINLSEIRPLIGLNRDAAMADLGTKGWYATSASVSFLEGTP